MLGSDGEEGRVGLESGLDEEEGRGDHGPDYARGGAGEDVDPEGLVCGRGVEVGGEGAADGFVEAETAAVEHGLVAVLSVHILLARLLCLLQCSDLFVSHSLVLKRSMYSNSAGFCSMGYR